MDTKAHRELCTVVSVVAPPTTRARTAHQCRRGGRYLGNTKFDKSKTTEKKQETLGFGEDGSPVDPAFNGALFYDWSGVGDRSPDASDSGVPVGFAMLELS